MIKEMLKDKAIRRVLLELVFAILMLILLVFMFIDTIKIIDDNFKQRVKVKELEQYINYVIEDSKAQ